jgi:hypothetical protein
MVLACGPFSPCSSTKVTCIRQSEPDIDLVETSRLMVTAGPDSDDAAGADTSESFFKEFDMLLDRSLLVVIWCKTLEINF